MLQQMQLQQQMQRQQMQDMVTAFIKSNNKLKAHNMKWGKYKNN